MSKIAERVLRMGMDKYLEIDALSASICIDIEQSCPMIAKYRRDNTGDGTNASEFGSAFHMALLQPEEFADGVVVVAADDWRTKAAREARDAAKDEGKIAILTKDLDKVMSMVSPAKMLLDQAGINLSDGHAEATFVADVGSGPIKSRMDWVSKSGQTIIDVKTCPDAKPDEFARHAANMLYHVQAAHQIKTLYAATGVTVRRYLWLAIERQEPFACSLNEAGQATLNIGGIISDRAELIWAECRKTGVYPGYGMAKHSVSLPDWYIRKVTEREQAEAIDVALIERGLS